MDLDIDALETSFDHVAVRGDELMDAFFQRLFAELPSVQPLFYGTDLMRVKALLLAALVQLRTSLRDLDSVAPALRGVGVRNARYGARPEHYPVVGEVLIASMASIAGDEWRVEHEKAWTAAWALVSATMVDGADTVGYVVRPVDAYRGGARNACAALAS